MGGWESPHRPSFDLISLIRTPIQTEFLPSHRALIGSVTCIAGSYLTADDWHPADLGSDLNPYLGR